MKNRKKRDTSQKRQIILDGAVKVFTEYGFEASSMDKIAETAGVSKRTVYNHFQSKESLFQTIVADFLSKHDEIKPMEYSKSLPLAVQLKEFVRAELYLVDDPVRRSLSRLLTSTFLMNTGFGNDTRNQHQPRERLISWLIEAQKDRKLKMKSPELAAKIFYGLVEGCLTWDALLTDGGNLAARDAITGEIISVFLSRYKYGK